MPEATETEAAAKLAAEPETFEVIPGDVEVMALPPGWTAATFDHEHLAHQPRRSSGAVTVRDAAGFIDAVNQRKTNPVSLYADEPTLDYNYEQNRAPMPRLVAVLNDDHAEGGPGWRDHIVTLELRHRPEWRHWMALDGRLVPQNEFARHIEDGLREIVTPASADMLDLAQSFQAITNAKFRGGQRLATGERQFMYDEEVAAKAGLQGQITIPDEFMLELAPFFGAEPMRLRASFRFQLRAAELSLGYKLDRPDELERAAFSKLVDVVAEELGVAAIAGVAPAPRSAGTGNFQLRA